MSHRIFEMFHGPFVMPQIVAKRVGFWKACQKILKCLYIWLNGERLPSLFCSQTYLCLGRYPRNPYPWCPTGQERVTFTVYPLGSFEFWTMSVYYLRKIWFTFKKWEWAGQIVLFARLYRETVTITLRIGQQQRLISITGAQTWRDRGLCGHGPHLSQVTPGQRDMTFFPL